MLRIFLSASVPLPERDAEFLATADVVAIREAVKALVSEVLPFGKIVFGGHPAITLLICMLLRGLELEDRKRIVLYQSAYFERNFLPEIQEFIEYRNISIAGISREDSLAEMRRRMIGDTPFDVGVFIGGMEGVIEEFEIFREVHPRAKIWPIASTGAAALKIFQRTRYLTSSPFLSELTYETLFRRLLAQLRQP